MSDPRRPILVTGAIRSGTTWVGRTLGTAPGVAVIHEPFNLDHPQGVFAHRFAHQYAYLAPGVPGSELVDRAIGDTLAFRYRPILHLRRHENPRRSLGLVRDLPLSWWRRALRRPRPLLKDPIAVFSSEWLAERFDMDVVITVRHPAAFAWSYLRIDEPNRFPDLLAQPALMEGPLAPHADDVARAAEEDDPIVQAALLWKIVYSVVDGYRSRHPRWVVRCHEDLACHPMGEFRDLFGWTGLPFTARTRRFVARTTSPGNPAEAPDGSLHHLRRDSRRSVGVWRHRLPAEAVARIRDLTEETANRFYHPSSWA